RKGGIAAMELVARDLKATGLYMARALSFAGVEYDILKHALTPDQIRIYDTYADAWAILWRAAHKMPYREEAVMRRNAA
ncbi:strawberry notch family protein, partial [Staphylococcus aureus]|nr:strawberry notch family protein [Staphylococcus aureus]